MDSITPEVWMAGLADDAPAVFYVDAPAVVDPYGFGYGRDNEDHFCDVCGADLMVADCRCH